MSKAIAIPRALLTPYSPDWFYQNTGSLKMLWTFKDSKTNDWAKNLRDIFGLDENYNVNPEGVKAWETIPEGHPYGSFRALVENEIGCPFDAFRSFIEALKLPDEIMVHFINESTPTLNSHGRPSTKDSANKVDNINSKPSGKGGTSKEYLQARLKRDRPDLLEQIGDGKKYKSVRAAAIDAGIIKPKKSLPISDNADEIAVGLYEILGDELFAVVREKMLQINVRL